MDYAKQKKIAKNMKYVYLQFLALAQLKMANVIYAGRMRIVNPGNLVWLVKNVVPALKMMNVKEIRSVWRVANVLNAKKILIVQLTKLAWQTIAVETALIMDTVREAEYVWRMANVVNVKKIQIAELGNHVWQVMCVELKLPSKPPQHVAEKGQFFILISTGILTVKL